MITFENPLFLHLSWGLLLLLLLYVVYRHWQAKAQLRLGDKALVERLYPGRSTGRSHTRFGVLLLAYTCFVIALANPVLPLSEEKRNAKEEVAMVFAIDVSRSMLVSDVLPNRLTQAKKLVREVTAALKGEEVGLVVFAGKAYPYLPLTTDYRVIESAVKVISTEMVPRQGTSFEEALKISSLLLTSRPQKARVICVLSDGESHTSQYGSLADSLSKAGVYVFSFGLGTEAGGHVPEQQAEGRQEFKKDKQGALVVSRLQEKNLIRLVGVQPARYARLGSAGNQALHFIEDIRQLPAPVATAKAPAKKELFQYFLLAALLLLVLELLIAPGKGVARFKRTGT
ncbi:VWA domain-containing protein [Pontibacter sp. SGAir0037]|uniref:VWA domain-containing protein n=1 Tax=Pontibacter sp. SGAir0037 TaxID=2571030 RepID=UPI0010CD0A0F|nr:VWA domain-containing protein [Pontibacter sp. SGAir0037]QCR21566.1 hypothetical protein C1N53_03855 [Pontibacter sp. SGAir0037]